jgi:hypothetical protein
MATAYSVDVADHLVDRFAGLGIDWVSRYT